MSFHATKEVIEVEYIEDDNTLVVYIEWAQRVHADFTHEAAYFQRHWVRNRELMWSYHKWCIYGGREYDNESYHLP